MCLTHMRCEDGGFSHDIPQTVTVEGYCDPQAGRTVTDTNRVVCRRNLRAPTHPIHPDHICLPTQYSSLAAAAVLALL